MYTFGELRNKYRTFEFTGFESEFTDDMLEVRYSYNIPGLRGFCTRWVFPAQRKVMTDVLHELLFSLGMAEAISYYKCVCPKTVIVSCGILDADRIRWWEKLFYKGLGEFQYRNGIDVTQEELLHIECTHAEDPFSVSAALSGVERSRDADIGLSTGTYTLPLHDDNTYDGIMVPIGGGKDSVVSLELLRDRDVYTYSINESDTIRNVIECCDHVKQDLTARRILDKGILEMNNMGYLNGHIPFSSVVAFSTVITSYLNGIKYIALSNESSAHESTVAGSFVNHQYSKSFEFESDFDSYIKKLTDSDIHYFSLLRPYAEIRIAALFARMPRYHSAFRSCNAGSKQGIWCCNCPKCLFVYIILSPFLTEDELTGIFGEKLPDKDSLDKDFRELTGIDENKPFECVGTRSEVCAAVKRFVKGGRPFSGTGMLPPRRSLLTDRYSDYIDGLRDDLDELIGEISEEHNIPDELLYTIERSSEIIGGADPRA